MVPSILRPLPQSFTTSSSISSVSMIQSIRHWWTQSNVKALQVSQDQLLQSCVQSPYVCTSFAGMNSVEFQRRKCVNDGTALVASSSSLLESVTLPESVTSLANSALTQSSSGHHSNQQFQHGNMNPLRHNNHDRRFYHTDQIGRAHV